MADEKPVVTEPNPAGDGGGDPAAGEAAGADGGEGNGAATDKVSIPRHEYDGLQAKSRESAALKARLAEVEANGAKPPTASPEVDGQRQKIEERQEILSELRAAAKAGNRDAKALLIVHEDALEAEQRTLYRLEMQEIPEARREEVRKFADKHGVSPLVADRFMRGEQAPGLESKIAELEKQIEDLKKAPQRTPPKDTRVAGGGPTGGGRRDGGPEEITTAEYNKRMEENPNATIKARRDKKFVLVD